MTRGRGRGDQFFLKFNEDPLSSPNISMPLGDGCLRILSMPLGHCIWIAVMPLGG